MVVLETLPTPYGVGCILSPLRGYYTESATPQ